MTSTLCQAPRYVVGSVNLTEFSITFATSATFIVTLESANLAPVIPLVFGGSSAPRSPVTCQDRIEPIADADRGKPSQPGKELSANHQYTQRRHGGPE